MTETTYLPNNTTVVDAEAIEYTGVEGEDGEIEFYESDSVELEDGSTDEIALSDFDESGGTSSPSGCKKISAAFVDEGTFGNDLWKFQNWTRWCWNRNQQVVNTVTQGFDFDVYDDVIEFEGVKAQERLFYDYDLNDGHPRSAYKNYRKAHFRQELPWTSINHYVGITIRSYYDGRWRFEIDSP